MRLTSRAARWPTKPARSWAKPSSSRPRPLMWEWDATRDSRWLCGTPVAMTEREVGEVVVRREKLER